MSRLRTATCDLEDEVQRVIERETPALAMERYRVFLARMYGFHAPLDRRLLLRAELAHVLPDLPQRQKTDLIATDLVALGVERETLDELPRCGDLPDLADLATALGCLYVLEVAAVAAEAVRPLLPATLAQASRYLGTADDETEDRWLAFVRVVEDHARSRAIGDRVVTGALETFEALVRWLGPAVPRPRDMLRAVV
ncbi:MAG TPA: biliverdin-producing heme oxygenase [Kofleriaceae bacterium]|nr:biliverdin-producing heme oxygenase [Kofleriaceae bacterium]